MPTPMNQSAEDRIDTERTEAIAKANDAFRKLGGVCPASMGRWVYTRSVAAKGADFLANAIEAVTTYDAFTEDNDPYGARDFGTMTIAGAAVWWKIDLYDAAYEYGSDDPLDPVLTRRVLTLLLPEDY